MINSWNSHFPSAWQHLNNRRQTRFSQQVSFFRWLPLPGCHGRVECSEQDEKWHKEWYNNDLTCLTQTIHLFISSHNTPPEFQLLISILSAAPWLRGLPPDPLIPFCQIRQCSKSHCLPAWVHQPRCRIHDCLVPKYSSTHILMNLSSVSQQSLSIEYCLYT